MPENSVLPSPSVNPMPFGTVYVSFDSDGEAFLLETARAMYLVRLRSGKTLVPWSEAHREIRQRFVDFARVAVTMTRVRYAAVSPGPAEGATPEPTQVPHG